MIRLISLEQREEDNGDREKRELEKEEKGSGGRRDGGWGWKRKGTEFVKLDISNNRGFKQSLRVTEEGRSSV